MNCLVFALVLYVLSYGPVLRYEMLTSDEGPARFYGPIDAAMERCEPFDCAMRWYLKAWGLRVNIPGWSKCGDF